MQYALRVQNLERYAFGSVVTVVVCLTAFHGSTPSTLHSFTSSHLIMASVRQQNKCCVRGLPHGVAKGLLEAAFAEHGVLGVTEIHITRSGTFANNAGSVAFVTFDNPGFASSAIALDGQWSSVIQQTLDVKPAYRKVGADGGPPTVPKACGCVQSDLEQSLSQNNYSHKQLHSLINNYSHKQLHSNYSHKQLHSLTAICLFSCCLGSG